MSGPAKKKKFPLIVTPVYGEPLRYRVSSQTHKGQHYIVDLSENAGHGACCCTRWTTTANVNLHNGGKRFRQATSCAHLRAVWLNFLENTLPDVAKRVAAASQPVCWWCHGHGYAAVTKAGFVTHCCPHCGKAPGATTINPKGCVK